jgi:GntR family transcriptional repressor for pyruvate dehydrogenase complex
MFGTGRRDHAGSAADHVAKLSSGEPHVAVNYGDVVGTIRRSHLQHQRNAHVQSFYDPGRTTRGRRSLPHFEAVCERPYYIIDNCLSDYSRPGPIRAGDGTDGMDVESLREPKMADRVATALRRMVIRGDIAPGTMLPPESELMERFGVSRPTLREAFRVLESESLITVERGVRGGARVHRPRQQTLARYAGLILTYEGVTLEDVYDARATIERAMVWELAKANDPEVIGKLQQIVDRDAQLTTGPDAVDQLTEFHAAIARLSGNTTLRMISGMIHHVIVKGNQSLQPTSGAQAEQAVRRSAKTHRMVLDLIRANDADGAADLWSRHLQESEWYLLSDSRLKRVVDLFD